MACYGAPKILDSTDIQINTAHSQGAAFDGLVIGGLLTCEQLRDIYYPLLADNNVRFWHPEFSLDLTDVRFFRANPSTESVATLNLVVVYEDSSETVLAQYNATIPDGETEGVFAADYYHGTAIDYEPGIVSVRWDVVSMNPDVNWTIKIGVLDWDYIDWDCFSSSFMTQCGAAPIDPYAEYFSSPVALTGDESILWTPTEFAENLQSQYPGTDCDALAAQIAGVMVSPDHAILTGNPLEKYTSVDAEEFLAAAIPQCALPPSVSVTIYEFPQGVSECANFSRFVNFLGIPKGKK